MFVCVVLYCFIYTSSIIWCSKWTLSISRQTETDSDTLGPVGLTANSNIDNRNWIFLPPLHFSWRDNDDLTDASDNIVLWLCCPCSPLSSIPAVDTLIVATVNFNQYSVPRILQNSFLKEFPTKLSIENVDCQYIILLKFNLCL